MSFLLFKLSNGEHRLSTADLKSTDERKILPIEILELLESEDYISLLKYYEEHVHFMDGRNPTAAWKNMVSYAEEHGTIHKKKVEYIDKETGEIKTIEKFDYYEPNDSKIYVEWIWDHAGLTESEKGMDLRQSINKLSEYFVLGRNLYKFIPILVYQQSSETQNLDAFKNNKVKASVMGLSDSKYPARDASMMFGITNPFAHEIPTYYNYDITKLRGNFRLLEVIVNRHGNSNGVIGLFFDGCTCTWFELPRPNEKERMENVYKYIESLKEKSKKLLNNHSTALLSYTKNNIKSIGNKNIFTTFAKFFTKLFK